MVPRNSYVSALKYDDDTGGIDYLTVLGVRISRKCQQTYGEFGNYSTAYNTSIAKALQVFRGPQGYRMDIARYRYEPGSNLAM